MARDIIVRVWDKQIKAFVAAAPVLDFSHDGFLCYSTKVVDQFTGLKDKNGVDIFENDILDFDEKEWGCKFKPEVVPHIHQLIGNWNLCGSPGGITEWRAVIGNVHQNPELLK